MFPPDDWTQLVQHWIGLEWFKQDMGVEANLLERIADLAMQGHPLNLTFLSYCAAAVTSGYLPRVRM